MLRHRQSNSPLSHLVAWRSSTPQPVFGRQALSSSSVDLKPYFLPVEYNGASSVLHAVYEIPFVEDYEFGSETVFDGETAMQDAPTRYVDLYIYSIYQHILSLCILCSYNIHGAEQASFTA